MLHLFMKTNDLLLVGVYCSLLDNTKMQYTAKAIYFVCCVIWFQCDMEHLFHNEK